MTNNPSSDNPNDFELPDAPHFLSKPPRLPFEVSVALIEENLEWTRKQPGFEEQRYRTKCHAEFIM